MPIRIRASQLPPRWRKYDATPRSKYGVDLSDEGKASRTYKGSVYASQMECDYAKHLDWLEGRRVVRRWKRQVKLPVSSSESHIVDFEVWFADGTHRYVEVKGALTDSFKRKFRALLRTNPQLRLDYKIVRRVRGDWWLIDHPE